MGQSKALHSLDEKQRRRRGCLGLHSLAERRLGLAGKGPTRPPRGLDGGDSRMHLSVGRGARALP